MIKLVLAGEDHQRRADKEAEIISGLQQKGRVVERTNLGKTDPEQLLTQLNTQAMFAQPKVLAIFGVEKLRSPKMLASIVQSLEQSSDDVVVTIAKKLTPGQKKLFSPQAWKVESFDLPKSVFAFCDTLKIKPYQQIHQIFRQVLLDGGEWWLHAQLSRTLYALLQAKAGINPGGAPFQVQKWKKQASAFSVDELKFMLDGLFDIEYRIKSGKTRLSWGVQFDILLAKLYDEPHVKTGEDYD